MKIKEIKEKFKVNTSEELFGLIEQPDKSCPEIDQGIVTWENLQQNIKGYCKDLSRSDKIDEVQKNAMYIEWEVDIPDILELYEEIREQCKKLRSWGQSWKDFAKKLIEENPHVIINMLANEK